MARFSIPTTAKLPSTLRVEASHPAVVKNLSRLSREGLISLALDWLDERAVTSASPYVVRRNRGPEAEEDDDDEDDPDDLYPPCRSIRDLQDLYLDLQQRKGSRRDVVSRILEGDWRHGLTLYQLAMVDLAYLDEHPSSQKWTAYQILPLLQPSTDAGEDEPLGLDKESLKIPRFHPSTFLQNLQDQVLPDVKAHYHFYRPKDFPVLILRIFVIDSPYNSNLALSSLGGSGTTASFDSSRTIYLAFPDGSSSLYVSRSQNNGISGAGESKSLMSLIVNGVPKALSRPRERFMLKATALSSKNLEALLDKKGPGRGNSAGGGWSVYANEKPRKSPLDSVLPTPPLSGDSSGSENSLKRTTEDGQNERATKRRKVVAKARFGSSGIVTDGKGVERLDILLQDPFPTSGTPDDTVNFEQDDDDLDHDGNDVAHGSRRKSGGKRRSEIDEALREAEDDDDEGNSRNSSQWTPAVGITFHGTHVFAGIRQLVEAGIVDGERMPGWMTGEEGVTTGVVRHGRIKGHKGSGMW